MDRSTAEIIFSGVDANSKEELTKKYQELKQQLEKRLENAASPKEKKNAIKLIGDLDEAFKMLSNKNTAMNKPAKGSSGLPQIILIVGILSILSAIYKFASHHQKSEFQKEIDKIYGAPPTKLDPAIARAAMTIKLDHYPYPFSSFVEEDNALFMDMVAIKGGSFLMGCDTVHCKDCKENELPQHEVKVEDFYIGRFEVNYYQFKRFIDSTNHHLSTDTTTGIEKLQYNGWVNQEMWRDSLYPAVNVSRDDALKFCNYLKEITAYKYRLPTEAEWEYAANAGVLMNDSTNKNTLSPGIDEVAWFSVNSNRKLHEAGKKLANPFGLYDMRGNVWELCADNWTDNYRETTAEGNEKNELQPDEKGVVRGGSFSSNEKECRVTSRKPLSPKSTNTNVGFRVALSKN